MTCWQGIHILHAVDSLAGLTGDVVGVEAEATGEVDIEDFYRVGTPFMHKLCYQHVLT